MQTTHEYKAMKPELFQSVLDSFIINSWSYSGVSTFARNEKAFEKDRIFNEPWKKSASMVGGSAYHEALEYYFNYNKNGERIFRDGELEQYQNKGLSIEEIEKIKKSKPDLIDLEAVAFDYIDSVPAIDWKIMKTTPTVEDAMKKANKIATDCISNFFEEISVYEEEIEEILGVELWINDFLTINGVDIPLPVHAKIDLVVKLKNGKIVIIDHKTATKYTEPKETTITYGSQGIIYVNCIETVLEVKVDEVWIIENKASKNARGVNAGKPQLNKLIIEISDDTKKLYEAMLYEPLKSMLEATSNPDHPYIINPYDNMVDKAEMEEFWIRTMTGEVEDFVFIHENKKDLIKKRLKKIRNSSIATISPKVIQKFKENAASFITYDLTNKNMSTSEKIEHRLRAFGIPAQIFKKFEGYSSDTYLLEISAGTKISNVYRHRLDIANALGVESVRMEENLFVYEGKSYFVVESSKKRTEDLRWDEKYYQNDQKIPIGITNLSETVYWDLGNHSTPYALVCGSAGSGKSVCLFSIIEYAKLAGVENFIIFDPKYEFTKYQNDKDFEIYNDIDDCEIMMADLVQEMNGRVKNGIRKNTMIIFDEVADAMQQSRKGNDLKTYKTVEGSRGGVKKVQTGVDKSLEENLKMLLQKGRSSGYKVVVATQRASTKIITGDAKANLNVQISFKVPKAIDSKVVLDSEGAELLGGQGDGLMNSPDYQNLMRFQGFWLP